MTDSFTNMDALFLQGLYQQFIEGRNVDTFQVDLIAARLLAIARNLQSFDDRQGSEYSRGWNDHKNSHLARSNLVKSTNIPVFPNLIEAMQNFKGEVTKLPPEQKQGMKDTLTIDDLDLGDL